MTAPLYSNVGRHGQGWDVDALVEIGGQNVRTRVHHDTSHPRQSWAKAEVWTPAPGGGGQWNEIATVIWQAWAETTAPQAGATIGLWLAVDELEARAHHLLDPPPGGVYSMSTGAPMPTL